jgi:anthranilate/para-aminobenzoate synthase component I
MHAAPLLGVDGPEDACLRLAGMPGLAWLDGNAPGREGRWSFVGVGPVDSLRVRRGEGFSFRALDLPIEPDAEVSWPGAPTPREVPCWIGWIAYDAAAHGPPRHTDGSQAGDVVGFARYDALAAFDQTTGQGCIVGDDARACERLSARLRSARPRATGARVREVVPPEPAAHLVAIERALDHIARGDIYQVNLARSWHASFEGDPLALFLAMRAASPVPLGFYFDDGACVVLGRSMERFLRWDRDRGDLVTRPIKGTVARMGGRDAAESARLRSDPKECAEHAMIVDLMRNDLGRVARVGTVEVPELMRVEGYAGLHHLVSTIRCETESGTTCGAILEATFPPGSVTGTPKVRAIEIIEALEACPRGVYTGAVGFMDRRGGLSLAVAIRTAVVAHGVARYWAGGGIVEASRPEHELAETELKARVFLDAVRLIAERPGAALSPPVVLR